MKEDENATPKQPEPRPAQDEVAKKAYAIYEKECRPQGHAEQNWSEAEAMITTTLSPELLQRMDAYWRAANYLSVGQIHLFDNPLLKRPLALEATRIAIGLWAGLLAVLVGLILSLRKG